MSDDDDKVGYGRPPRHRQFRPGQSGNPRGRPKGARGLKTDLHAELVSRMTIRVNGEPVTASKQRLMLKTLTARAASGDIRAINTLVELVLQVFGTGDAGPERRALSPGDQQILEDIFRDRTSPDPGQVDLASAIGEESGA